MKNSTRPQTQSASAPGTSTRALNVIERSTRELERHGYQVQTGFMLQIMPMATIGGALLGNGSAGASVAPGSETRSRPSGSSGSKSKSKSKSGSQTASKS